MRALIQIFVLADQLVPAPPSHFLQVSREAVSAQIDYNRGRIGLPGNKIFSLTA
jgi:hypothetical protein